MLVLRLKYLFVQKTSKVGIARTDVVIGIMQHFRNLWEREFTLFKPDLGKCKSFKNNANLFTMHVIFFPILTSKHSTTLDNQFSRNMNILLG